MIAAVNGRTVAQPNRPEPVGKGRGLQPRVVRKRSALAAELAEIGLHAVQPRRCRRNRAPVAPAATAAEFPARAAPAPHARRRDTSGARRSRLDAFRKFREHVLSQVNRAPLPQEAVVGKIGGRICQEVPRCGAQHRHIGAAIALEPEGGRPARRMHPAMRFRLDDGGSRPARRSPRRGLLRRSRRRLSGRRIAAFVKAVTVWKALTSRSRVMTNGAFTEILLGLLAILLLYRGGRRRPHLHHFQPAEPRHRVARAGLLAVGRDAALARRRDHCRGRRRRIRSARQRPSTPG